MLPITFVEFMNRFLWLIRILFSGKIWNVFHFLPIDISIRTKIMKNIIIEENTFINHLERNTIACQFTGMKKIKAYLKLSQDSLMKFNIPLKMLMGIQANWILH